MDAALGPDPAQGGNEHKVKELEVTYTARQMTDARQIYSSGQCAGNVRLRCGRYGSRTARSFDAMALLRLRRQERLSARAA